MPFMRHLVFSTFAYIASLIRIKKKRLRETLILYTIHITLQSIAQSQWEKINGSILFTQFETDEVILRVSQMTHFKGVAVSNPDTQLHKTRPGLWDY